MADLLSNSFIPKRGPVKRNRETASRQVYFFTIISYVLMFATLLAAGSVYLYAKYIDRQLENEVAALNSEINSFSEADMQQVIEFDRRLSQAHNRLNNSVSIVSVFDALEAATIDTVKIVSLDLNREKDEKFILSASIETDSFDSTIFQRGVYKRNQIIDSVLISGVQSASKESDSDGKSASSRPLITFTAELEVPLSAVPYVDNINQVRPDPITEPVLEQVINEDVGVESDVSVDNEENI